MLPDLFEMALAPCEGDVKNAQRCKLDQLSQKLASSLLLICHHLMAEGIPALQPLSISQVRMPLYFQAAHYGTTLYEDPMLSTLLVKVAALHPVSSACLLTF
jgi:hypothetical protein